MTPKLSASRLNDYLGCAHHTALWLAGVVPQETADPSLDLLRRRGFEHEAVALATLESRFGPGRNIAGSGPSEDRLRATAAAIEDGAPLIYQAALRHGAWIGYPDFLIRGERSPNGKWSYRPEDAKLARRAKPSHVLQLNVYAALLERAHGIPVTEGAIHMGGGEPERFDLRKTSTIAARYMNEFESFAALPERLTKPVRVGACGQCPFQAKCEAEWRAADSTVFVAGIRNDQMLKLEEAGVSTLTQLAELKPTLAVANLATETREKLVSQARLQATYAATGKHIVETLPVEPGRGFKSLPVKSAGDLFFDMEGDPLYPEGLEYLFGIWGPVNDSSKNEFKAFWAHDHAAEKHAFEDAMRFFTEHLARFPDAHIYHYAAYEVTAFKRLAMRYATMEAELDQMLRDHKFVDLYRITRQAIRASTESYSLKDLEKIYWDGRTGEVANAGDSIVEYERWRELGDQTILDAIEHYNLQDCTSTEGLRDWLEEYRPEDGDFALTGDTSDEDAREGAEERQASERERQSIATLVRASDFADERVRDLVCELMWFHQRAAKPQWWAVFDRQTWSDDELVDDFESLGALTLDPDFPSRTEKRSFVTTYRFPPQETKLEQGHACRIALTTDPAGTIFSLDTEEGRVSLKRGTGKGMLPVTCSLGPSGPIDTKVLATAVVEMARRLADGDFETDQAFLDLLARRAPRLTGHAAGQSVIAGTRNLLDEAVDAVQRLDRTCLIIQGPPGTGKTYTTAHAIVALLKDGKRVGVTSNSHKAINNVLEAVEKVARIQAFAFRGVKKASHNNPESEFTGNCVSSVFDSTEVSPADSLVGGTPFHFARADQWGAYDYLFVDEAGQVALGNLAAMSAVAKNFVLVGDQMQLSQPVQGVHPGESGQSCLSYAMQDHATVPPERGILLNITWRMHPDVCAFISETVYDNRLTPHPSTSDRVLVLSKTADPRLKVSGLSFVPVDHDDCIQSSVQEAQVVLELVEGLLRQTRRTDKGDVVPMTLADIVVVAPYNLQVNLLRRTLPAGSRVGTVDKFQGQEATVAIVSMATSCGEEAPRGTDFLFNTNRINVALSRAETLAILVCGIKLLDFVGNTIPDLWRLNVFAKAEAL